MVVRDTQHVVLALWTMLFFASPVLYRLDALPLALRGIASLNPLSGVIGLYRTAVLGFPIDSPTPFAACLVVIGVGWVGGTLLLERLDQMIDEYL